MANRPPLKVAKDLIHRFAYNLLPKQYLKAIELILSPCCSITVVSAEAVCNGGNYDITLTLSEPISLLGRGYAFLVKVSDLATGAVVNVVDGSDTLVFLDVPLPGLASGMQTIVGQIVFVTRAVDVPSTNLDIINRSVVVTSLVTNIILPNC